MILNQLRLCNFCLYGGEQVFDLTPTRRIGRAVPIVLFGGINGGGKTTLLDAVQLVLYGNRARCSKRADKSYDQFLRESIHHGVDPSEGATIQLSFRYAEEGQEHIYDVSRSWSFARERVREKVQVSKNGEMDGWLSENWNQLVEDMIPFGVAQLCFFDAEKIRFLAEDETSTQLLGGAIKSLLGLDLAERLVADAAALEARVVQRSRKSPGLREFDQLEAALASKQAEIEIFVQDLGALENPLQAAQNRARQAEEKFSRVGGQHWEQREDRQRQLGELKHALEETENQLVALAASELPLALVPELLRDVAAQADREKKASENEIISSLLTERDQQLLTLLRRKRVGDEAIELVEGFLDGDRRNRCKAADVDDRHQLSDGGRRLLHHVLERGLPERLVGAKTLVDQFHRTKRALEDVQRNLAATPAEESVRGVAEELKAASAEAASLEQQAKRLAKQLESLRGERDAIQTELKKLRRKAVDEEIGSEEDARVAQLLIRTQETMQEFLRRATASKIDHLSELVTEAFRYLLRKKTLVERVMIDPESFTITLYNDSGQPVPKQRLSEGEKQIFAISVLWGLSQASARPLPTIIDTPMARLDAEHRSRLVELYFPHASHQVIVLSTDTEIDRRYFQELQPHIARAYHLNYDEQTRVTVAEEGYFWDAEAAV